MSGAQGSNGRFWRCSAGGFRLIIRVFWDVLGVFCQDWNPLLSTHWSES